MRNSASAPVKALTEQSADSLRYLKGIGPQRARAFAKLGIHTLKDLLYFFPRRYDDRTHFKSTSQIQPGISATYRLRVLSSQIKRFRKICLLEVSFGDDRGILYGTWFNQPYLKKYFIPGLEVILHGRAEFYQNRFRINSPEFEFIREDGDDLIHMGRITPIYPLTSGLFQRSLRTIQKQLIDTRLYAFEETLPNAIRLREKLIPLREAIQNIHFPNSFEQLAEARRRIAFDEFLKFELMVIKRNRNLKSKFRAFQFSLSSFSLEEFESNLPFKLTNGQCQAIRELQADLSDSRPMNRLIQGDVGSGKTVLAAFAMMLAARSGFQSAFLVPTEVLANQHYRSLVRMFESFGMETAVLTANTPSAKKEKLVGALKENRLKILIGTHALLSDKIQFSKLALLVVDEQHKFGVHQRHKLLEADPRPHQLVMTATPIPRTLALTLYGDLDVTLLKELPAGRKPIQTFAVSRQSQEQVLARIRKKIESGEQAYFIFPVIEESEKTDLRAAVQEFQRLSKGPLAGLKVGLVHGRLPAEERDSIMRSFESGHTHALVATSVIEVGINNPNATMLVIENAERFGLSQLHQMRGRIGRGEKSSECYLFGDPKSDESKQRFHVMTRTQDGFVIAEEDLKLRGPGDFWGTRQSGESAFKIADLVHDYEILLAARRTARQLLEEAESSGAHQEIKKILDHLPLRY